MLDPERSEGEASGRWDRDKFRIKKQKVRLLFEICTDGWRMEDANLPHGFRVRCPTARLIPSAIGL